MSGLRVREATELLATARTLTREKSAALLLVAGGSIIGASPAWAAVTRELDLLDDLWREKYLDPIWDQPWQLYAVFSAALMATLAGDLISDTDRAALLAPWETVMGQVIGHSVTPFYDHDMVLLRFECHAWPDSNCRRPCGCAGADHVTGCTRVAINPTGACNWLDWVDDLPECGPDREFDLNGRTSIVFEWDSLRESPPLVGDSIVTRRRVNSTAGNAITLLPVILLWLIAAVMIIIAVAVSSSLGCGWSGTCGIRYDPR